MGSASEALEASATAGPGSGVAASAAIATAGGPTSGRRRATLAELRAQLGGDRLDQAAFPVLPALGELFPGRGLRKGAAYAIDGSTSLLLAMLAGPSQAGSWCGVVGVPDLGLEAADGYGVELDRLVLVPTVERRWLETVAALIDVLDVVVVRPPGSVADSDARRLAARLRERGSALIVLGDPSPLDRSDDRSAAGRSVAAERSRSAGRSVAAGRGRPGRSGAGDWSARAGGRSGIGGRPGIGGRSVVGDGSVAGGSAEFGPGGSGARWAGCELRFTVAESRWEGLGAGHGHLAARQVTVLASGRGAGGRSRTSRLWLPDRNGAVSPVREQPAGREHPAGADRPLGAERPGTAEQSGEVIELARARAGVPPARRAG